MKWTSWEMVQGFNFTDIIYEKRYHEKGGGVARITFNRPRVLNAFTGHTVEEMGEAICDASHDKGIGVVVLTGTGDNAFSAGGDVRWLDAASTEKDLTQSPAGMIMGMIPVPDLFLRRCRKPIIAAVKGYAIGGGHHIAYMCDFTIAAENAIFGQAGPRVGSPADGYVVAYLTFVVGAKKAREIWMLTRQYNAQEALKMGLVNTVVPLDKFDEEVDKWCEEVLAHSPTCISILKATFDSVIDYMDGSVGKFSNMIAPYHFEGEEFKEATTSFLEKRKPNFWKTEAK